MGGMMFRLALAEIRALEQGELVLAEIESYEARTETTGKTRMTYHYYTVSYLDADGEQCRSTRKSLNRWSTSSSGDLVPLFLGPDGVFTSVYEYHCVGIGDAGELVYTGWKEAGSCLS